MWCEDSKKIRVWNSLLGKKGVESQETIAVALNINYIVAEGKKKKL